jgi:hypothetical protein
LTQTLAHDQNLGRNGMMMDLAKKMPELIALRDALYSNEFKEFVQVRMQS